MLPSLTDSMCSDLHSLFGTSSVIFIDKSHQHTCVVNMSGKYFITRHLGSFSNRLDIMEICEMSSSITLLLSKVCAVCDCLYICYKFVAVSTNNI